MTVTEDASMEDSETPPPPPPAVLSYSGKYAKNPLEEVGFANMCGRLPSVRGRTARMARAVDRGALVLLLACQVLTGVAAAIVLGFTAKAMMHVLGVGTVSARLPAALPALLVVSAASAVGRFSSALASYADGRVTPRLMTEADVALVAAVCRVEASAHGEDGFSDRQEAAEAGVTRTTMMVQDAQRFMAALTGMIAAAGVITACTG
ncbi:hypothetical protein QFZ74_000089 [Streptomyces sp. V3I7]|nr:hypothetical protein [Streptomyces sp. V3I7]